MFTFNREDFGKDFVFGAATAAYQIEGGQTDGRGPSIWDSFAATPGNVTNGDTGRIACDHYHRWPEDLDLVRDAGFDAYRFSFAWPRLIPDGRGAANPAGFDFYDRLIDGMLERGILPYATLYHWDLPSALQDLGGWLNRDVAGWFADYAERVHKAFGDRLASVATVNEPWCAAFLSHYLGIHAPGHRDLRSAARAMHHILFAHGSAVEALRAQGGRNIGIVLNPSHASPASGNDADRHATQLWDGFYNRWYYEGVLRGIYPADVIAALEAYLPAGFEADMTTVGAPIDWLGINYYSRSLVAHDPDQPVLPARAIQGPLETTEMGWEIYPAGLSELLEHIAGTYGPIPLHVSENGMAEVEGVTDPRRVRHSADHLQAVLDAKARGADVRGYFAWSLLDNFEWSHG